MNKTSGRSKKTVPDSIIDILARRNKQQAKALEVLNSLHGHGFRSLSLESVMVGGSGEEFFLKVIVGYSQINHDQMTTLYEVAKATGSRILLDELCENQMHYSRIVLWPMVEGE